MRENRICFESVDGAPARGKLFGGFSLIELLVALSLFLIVGSAAFTLFGKQQTSFLRQQGMAGMNVALRNASAQMQVDLVNAGTAFFQGANIPSWPVGVTIVNNVVTSGNSCYDATTFTYTAQCFDSINIISVANPATYPPSNATDSSGANGATNCSTTSTGTGYAQAATGLTLAQTAAKYAAGDEVLERAEGNHVLRKERVRASEIHCADMLRQPPEPGLDPFEVVGIRLLDQDSHR